MQRKKFVDVCRLARSLDKAGDVKICKAKEVQPLFSNVDPKMVSILLGEMEVPNCLFEGRLADRIVKRAEFTGLEMSWDPEEADAVHSNTRSNRVKRLLGR